MQIHKRQSQKKGWIKDSQASPVASYSHQ